jgi:hypothetical protein
VYEYSGRDVRELLVDGPDPRLEHRGRSVFCIEARCGTPDCVAPVRILAVMGNDADPNVEGEKLLLEMHVHEICCIVGDPLTRSRGTPPRFYFDNDWNPY